MDGHSPKNTFGSLLRAHRIRQGATQRQLADLSTVSVRAIRDLELGRAHRPRRDTVRLIADGLGLSGRVRTEFELAARNAAGDLEWPAPPPAPLDSLVGRESEVAVLHELLASGDQRMVTIAGLSGVGKTRIALEVAGVLHGTSRMPVLWYAANRPATVSRTQAAVAGLLTSGSSADELSSLLGSQPALLVLDGCEPEQVSLDRLTTLLGECRGLRVLSTAREPFDAPGERIFPLAPLAVPKPGRAHDLAELAAVPSLRLLTRAIRQVHPRFELTLANAGALAALCRRLDGVPVALEAAASWFLVYEPEVLLEHVTADPFDLLGRPVTGDGAPGLRELLGRAVDSLDAAESSLLGRLAAVDSGWSIGEAAELTGVPPASCAQLVRRLLVRGVVRPADGADRVRFRTLDLVRSLCFQRELSKV
ncbi:helix-turn-helix domain-containing protein [Amycolatopsis nigrescens]|uniref:helix-turn-helix domain-containing protein n=1 Tax=Amycolatopsis nigrescens TaxID=381445 RepID=UPI000382DBF1|nr:helix-turn-helix domain-containing protein [Amycolatopsis nigrescens]